MMSVSKWAYSPERCDGQPCCGDCDLCNLMDIDIGDSEDEFPQSSHKVPKMAESLGMMYNMMGRTVAFISDLQEKRALHNGRRWGE